MSALRRGELLAVARPPGRDQHRARAAPGLRLHHGLLQIEEAARIVERLRLGPAARHDVDPFLAQHVAVVVRAEVDAEHVELFLVPAADDVEAEAPLADMVGGHHLLRRDDGVDRGDVHRAERHDPARRGEKARRPGEGLEARPVMVGGPAIAFPAPERQHEVEPGVVGHAGEGEVVPPARLPPLGENRGGEPAGAVGAEQAERKAYCGRGVAWRRCSHIAAPEARGVATQTVPNPVDRL